MSPFPATLSFLPAVDPAVLVLISTVHPSGSHPGRSKAVLPETPELSGQCWLESDIFYFPRGMQVCGMSSRFRFLNIAGKVTGSGCVTTKIVHLSCRYSLRRDTCRAFAVVETSRERERVEKERVWCGWVDRVLSYRWLDCGRLVSEMCAVFVL